MAKQFNFVSPGVFLDEIDNSQLPAIPRGAGPILIGRASRGTAMRPVQVGSAAELIEAFGYPDAGGRSEDVWRNGNHQAPTYGLLAAQAYLKNALNQPVTFIRLLGEQSDDATSAGKAGWQTTVTTPSDDVSTNGGAYGLFIINSSSQPTLTDKTGSLAAVFYLDEGAIYLSGNLRDTTDPVLAGATFVESYDDSATFTVEIHDDSDNVVHKTRCNFVESSQNYIRNRFNTNPTLTNTTITNTANVKTYWLGETFERSLQDHVSLTTKSYGIIMALASGSVEGADYRMGTQPSKSGWVFSQDVTTNYSSYDATAMTKLFRFVALESGEYEQANFKVSIEDVVASPTLSDGHGRFNVVVRAANDTDGAMKVVERFSDCSLNPAASNYVAKKIGNMYSTWDASEMVYKWYGDYPNQSKYIRVEMNSEVDAGSVDPVLLPFGVFGPPRYKGFTLHSSSTTYPSTYGTDTQSDFANSFLQASGSVPSGDGGPTIEGQFVKTGNIETKAAFVFPSIPMRSSSYDGNLANHSMAYFGADSTKYSVHNGFDPSWKDVVRPKPYGVDSYDPDSTTTEYSFVFTLDDVLPYAEGSDVGAAWASGSRLAGTSLSALSSSWEQPLTAGFNSFTLPMFGGFDGLDVKEMEPFRNTKLSGGSATTNYAYNTVKKAIDVAEDDMLVAEILSMPGLTNESLTSHLLSVAESRRDCIAIIDLNGDYAPRHEGTSDTRGSVNTVVSNLKARGINNGYGATYYSWLQARDPNSDTMLWVPPSIGAIGTFASSARKSEVWFAPAGFTRGGLSEGSAGIQITNVRERLTARERDKLYDANINPIASFPNEGIVIYGQKTLQTTKSALDRINVRRLLNYVKKQISAISKTLLFEPNVQATWHRFTSQVNPLLRDIQARYGLYDFKVVLDESTTTPELIDRNIMYAKIFLQPTRTVEFIAVDFNLTETGASFTD